MSYACQNCTYWRAHEPMPVPAPYEAPYPDRKGLALRIFGDGYDEWDAIIHNMDVTSAEHWNACGVCHLNPKSITTHRDHHCGYFKGAD